MTTYTFSYGGGTPPYPGGLSSTTPPGGNGDLNLQAFQQSAMQNPDLAGVIQTIEGWGGDVKDAITGLLPKNADGSIDWGKVGKDVGSYIKNNASTILSGLNAYNQYERQNKSDALAQDAFNTAKQQYADKQPLRDAGMAGMLDPSKNAPDLTQLGKLATAGSAITAPKPIPLAGSGVSNLQSVAANNPFAPQKPIPLAGGPSNSTPQAPATPIPLAPQPYVPSKPTGSTATPVTGTPGSPVAPLAPPPLPIALQGPATPKPKYLMPPYPAASNVAPIPLAGQ